MLNTSQIKPHTPVVCSNNIQFGVVDHVEGKDTIKLTRDDKGQHHYIPLSWVKSVDDKVHVDRPGDQAMREWKTTPPADAAKPNGDAAKPNADGTKMHTDAAKPNGGAKANGDAAKPHDATKPHDAAKPGAQMTAAPKDAGKHGDTPKASDGTKTPAPSSRK